MDDNDIASRLRRFQLEALASYSEMRRKLAEHDARRRRASEIGESVIREFEQEKRGPQKKKTSAR